MPDFLLRKDSGELEFVTGTEPLLVTPTSGPGSYDVYRLDNSTSVVLQGAGDTQAPSIDSLSAVVANNQATLNWSTDEAGGTTYWVCTDATTVPSTTQIIAGQDHTGAAAEASGAQAVDASGAQSTAPVDGLQDGQTYSFHLLQRDAGGNASGTLTSTVTVPLPSLAPVLSDLIATGDETTATLSYATTAGSGGMYWVMTTSAQAPESWRIKREEDHAGTPALAAGSQRPSTAGTQPDIVVSDLAAGGTYHFHMYHRADGETSAVASTSVTLEEDQPPADTTAPILSGVSASLAGNTATLSWSSDEAGGTGYWVCTTAAVTPSAAQIIAGEDHTGTAAVASGAQAVSSSGAQADQTVPGLSAGATYFFHLLHRDGSQNTSTRVSTAGVTVASSGVSAEINVVKRSNLEIAPDALTFDVTLTGFDTPGPRSGEIYNPQLHELYYLWDFDDDYTFSAPLNLITEHNRAGVGYGPVVTHTYRSAGSYNVSCLIVEPSSGKTTTASLSVTVGDADTQFAGTSTLFVSEASDWTNAPSGAVQYTSFSSAWNDLKHFPNPTHAPRRIMLNRGETFTLGTNGYTGNAYDQISSVHICSGPGDGAKPVLNTTTGEAFNFNDWSSNSSGIDVVTYGVDFDGPWDSQTETGNSPVLFFSLSGPPGYLMMDDCVVTGFGGAYSSNHFDNPDYDYANFYINDTVITDRRTYGIFFEDGNVLSVVGSRVDAHVNANAGGPQGTNNEAGCVRAGGSDIFIVTNSSMFNRMGWTALGSAPVTQVYQPCLRVNGSGTGNPTVNVTCNSFEGANIYSSGLDNGGTLAVAVNQIIDKNYFLGGSQTWDFIGVSTGALTARNNIFVNPAVDRNLITTNEFESYVSLISHGNSTAEALSAPIKVYSNTMVNLQSEAQYPSAGDKAVAPVLRAASVFTSVVAENNVRHQPNTTASYTADAPLEASPALFTPLEIGYKDRTRPLISGTGTPASTAATYQPAIGSPALGDALAGNSAYDDFFGSPRPQYPSRGATEIR